MIKALLLILNVLVVVLLIWSLINYKFLNNEVTNAVQIWGLLAMVLFVFVLEGAPVFVGGSVAVASVLAMATFNPWLILFLFLASAILGNVAYYYLGHHFGLKVLKYFDRRDVRKYKRLFHEHGRTAMIVMALSPIPYLPTLAGAFRMDKFYMFVEIMGLRIIRHIIVFLFWYFLLVGI